MRVTLAKAIRLPGQPLRARGAVIDVDEATAERLRARGVLVDETAAPEPAPVKVDPPVKDEKPEGVDGVEQAAKPAKSAKIELWQDYARANGLDPKGLSKQELIAALS